MSLGDDLIVHAIQIMPEAGGPLVHDDVNLRRAVSASYYALFHKLNERATIVIAPNVGEFDRHRIQRWFDHGEMKKVCKRFLPERLEQPLLDLIGTASNDLRNVCHSFVMLQEVRHSADDDLNFRLTWEQARQHIQQAIDAIAAWERIGQSPEANIFILSLLLWKNWEKDRP